MVGKFSPQNMPLGNEVSSPSTYITWKSWKEKSGYSCLFLDISPSVAELDPFPLVMKCQMNSWAANWKGMCSSFFDILQGVSLPAASNSMTSAPPIFHGHPLVETHGIARCTERGPVDPGVEGCCLSGLKHHDIIGAMRFLQQVDHRMAHAMSNTLISPRTF